MSPVMVEKEIVPPTPAFSETEYDPAPAREREGEYERELLSLMSPESVEKEIAPPALALPALAPPESESE